MDIQQRRPQRGGDQPFDQRFLLFAVIAMATLMLFNSTAPPPVEEKPVEDAAAQVAVEAPLPDAEVEPSLPAEEAADLEEAPAEAERIALGSADPNGAYRMLLTVNNVGGAIERVELASENYRDLDDRSGYLGQLALTDAPSGGALVNIVGAGTPAEAAGLEPGDVITGVQRLGAKPGKAIEVTTARDLLLVIDATKPGRELQLSVARNGEPETLTAELRRQPLDLMRPEVENIRLHSPEEAEKFQSVPSFVVRLASANGLRSDAPAIVEANRQLADEPWTVDDREAESVTLRQRLAGLGLEVVKRFGVVETPETERENHAFPSYHFDLAVEVRNLRDEPQTVAYELTGPNGLPIEGYWYANKIGRGDGSFFGDWGSFGLRDVVVRFANDRLTQYAAKSVADGDVRPMGQGRPLAFAGVDAQYFASIVIPQKPSLAEVRTAEVRAVLATEELPKRDQARWQNTSLVLESEPVTLGAAGGDSATATDDFRVFAGPKLPELLQAYSANDDANHSLHDILYYGWFGWVAKPMLWLLHTFNGIVGNYGLAIVMLTICVRGAMFPISRQTAMNMVKMQQLKPEMDRLAERYKDDMPKRSQAQQELFRKHNYNPAAGCLPMFIQLPIFMGLYRALAVDVELRQAPLISDAIRFCSNLAAPDMFYDWSAYTPQWMDNGQGLFGFGPYFNLLPLATCGLFLLQQKLFMPEPTNDQARMQQQMMKYMMLFMGLMFFKVPSGLCIYFIASSLWGIAERKMLPRPTPPETSAISPTTSTVKSPSAANSAVKARAAKKAKNKKRK
ncbi:Membrane protein insertase YidC [Botrimarina colliarenosi]|uniref:Membrane protein insertase YidC n=1 Tax=Botrimarina colliarenosi TaxID=2528001 RepID=A0A5C6A5E6_9BACT|nr:YidC/Oxa1 family insertase periplasmic-domain containing protein [Botrimarina colliarenosi]TWT95202.1 Membrane protein insertase YidC [Botrimarina colliarenosi]